MSSSAFPSIGPDFPKCGPMRNRLSRQASRILGRVRNLTRLIPSALSHSPQVATYMSRELIFLPQFSTISATPRLRFDSLHNLHNQNFLAKHVHNLDGNSGCTFRGMEFIPAGDQLGFPSPLQRLCRRYCEQVGLASSMALIAFGVSSGRKSASTVKGVLRILDVDFSTDDFD